MPLRCEILDDLAHLLVVVDNVGADALRDFDRDCGVPVEAGIAIGILESTPDVGNVGKRDDTLSGHLDWKVENVFAILEEAGDLHGEAALARVDVARRDQAVVQRDDIDELALRDVVGLELRGVDDDLQQFFPMPDELRLQHSWNALDLVFQASRGVVERSFGYVA